MKMGGHFVLSIFMVIFISWEVHAAVNCTSAGRFSDTDDTTCKNYTLCVLDSSTNTFLSYNYTCPTTSLFDPATSTCTASSSFVCNSTSSTNSTTSDCTAEGFFSDPDSTDCSSYIGCVDIDGTYVETVYDCPDSTYYDPDTTLCESDYTCEFTCSTSGRFADSSDSTCQTYYLCVLSSNGTYVQYTYTCPSTSVFSPTTSLCTTSYTCSS